MRTLTLSLLLGLLSTAAAFGQSYPYAIKTLAGVEPLGNGGPAKTALLDFPWAVAVDSSNNVYIADGNSHGIRKIDSSGNINLFSTINAVDLKVDAAGNVYAADGFATVYKITPAGVATAIAGGSVGFGGDGGPATAARLSSPQGIAFDSQQNLYIADTDNCRIRKVSSGVISTVAGSGVCGLGGYNGQALAAQLAFPSSVAVDSSGNIYIAEYFYILKVFASSGLINVIAGNGDALANGPAANSAIGLGDSLATDSSGNLYIADPDFDLVRVISGANIRTIAGMSPGGVASPGFSGDGGPGTSAQLFNPIDIALDSNGFVYIADQYNQRIRKLDQAFNISTIAGTNHYGGDSGPAASALLDLPETVTMDSNGYLYFADTFNNRVRRITPAGVVTTVAGTGECGYSGDSGPATAAKLCHPFGLAVDAANNLYIADSVNSVVREVGINGFINTVVGTGDYGDTGTNVLANTAHLEFPYGLAFDPAGNLYISDYDANRVRKVTPDRVITYFAGNSNSSFSGDGGLATSAAIDAPEALATDSAGNLYIADTGNERVRKVSTGGVISTVAGTTQANAARTNATSTFIGAPGGMAVDAFGNLFISEPNLGYIVEVTPAGAISSVAGNGKFTFDSDGLALNAALNGPGGMTLDVHGNLYFADVGNSRIRELIPDAPTQLSISGGDGQTGNAGATLQIPLTVTASFQGGTPVSGLPVTFSLTSGSATLSATSTVTDANGTAGISVTLGNAPGPVVITAALGSFSVVFHLTAITPTPLPTVSAGGVDGAGGSVPAVTAISPGGLASIYGFNFAPTGTSRQVQGSDLVNGALPTNLAGVCVQVDGQPAFLTYVSPGQVNIQVPAVRVGASVPLQVTTGCGSATPLAGPAISVSTLAATPEFLFWVKNATGANPVIAVNAVTGAYVGAAGLIPGVTFTPAKPGDYLTIYGISFGVTNPAVPPGAASVSVAPVANAAVTLGASPLPAANLIYVGASPGTAGLYQVNIQVPAGLADGDYALTLNLGSFSTPAGAYLTVRN
jgi:uncharacterized protein (TIGR03437 family)